jgi:hypothetical protein
MKFHLNKSYGYYISVKNTRSTWHSHPEMQIAATEILTIVLVEAMPDQCVHTSRSVELDNKNKDHYHYLEKHTNKNKSYFIK